MLAYERLETLKRQGQDTSEVDSLILGLRREQRDGPQIQPGHILANGRYFFHRLVNQGGFGSVWLARDLREEREVAIKLLHGQFMHDQSARERFCRGAQRMASLAHRHIVRVLRDVEEEDQRLYFVMEFIPGGDLKSVVENQQLTESQILNIILDVGSGIEYAHSQNLIHRDIKPTNILLADDGAAKLTDFDLVWASDTTGGTRNGIGTVGFTPPELLRDGNAVRPESDVFALAATAVWALSPQRPSAYDMLYSRCDKLVEALGCTEAVKAVFAKALMEAPQYRHRSMQEFRAALEKALTLNTPDEVTPLTFKELYLVLPPLHTGFVYVDLSVFDTGLVLKIGVNPSGSYISFLNLIWNRAMRDHVPSWTYALTWILYDVESGYIFPKQKTDCSLKVIGIRDEMRLAARAVPPT